MARDSTASRDDDEAVGLAEHDMQLRWLLLTLLCVSLLAVGQMLFKSAAAQWRFDGWSWSTVSTVLSPAFVAAFVLFALVTVLWVTILRSTESWSAERVAISEPCWTRGPVSVARTHAGEKGRGAL